MFTVTTKMHGNGIFAKLKAAVNRILGNRPAQGPKRVKVGFPAGKVGGAEMQKAIWNEFGTRGGASGGGWGGPVPERPFFRNSMGENAGKYRSYLMSEGAKILVGKGTLPIALNRLGLVAQGDIQESITALSSPPNSPVTIALKGSSNPLIDTGAMRQAVTYEVDQ